jgi:hypothetical protein
MLSYHRSGIHVPYVQLATYVPYCVPPGGPTRHAYVPASLARMLPYPYSNSSSIQIILIKATTYTSQSKVCKQTILDKPAIIL